MEAIQLKIKRIFFASPGDLQPERELFVKIVNEVNEHKAHSQGIHLDILGWEKVNPGTGRPQGLINRLIMMSDLFVMAMWKRWGTPSGEFTSGTEEEFYIAKNLFQESGRPEMSLFFKGIDKIEEHNIDDCKKVIDFRKQIEQGKEFLYKRFNTMEEWADAVRKLLFDWVEHVENDTPVIDKIEDSIVPLTEDILIEITFLDRFAGHSKEEIYFTICDENSLKLWKFSSEEDRKKLLYYYLSRYLYLTLGVNTYKGIMRYKLEGNRYLVLGLISFTYGAQFEESKFYFPLDYHQIIISTEKERTLLDLHSTIY